MEQWSYFRKAIRLATEVLTQWYRVLAVYRQIMDRP